MHQVTDKRITRGRFIDHVDGECGQLEPFAAVAQHRGIQLRSVRATLEAGMDIQGILGMDRDVRNGFDDIKVDYEIDADASREDIEAVVAQSQKRSAVFDIITNPTDVSVTVR